MTVVLWFALFVVEEREHRLLEWMIFLLGQMAFYAALRSGWSERFSDPALTTAQIIWAIGAVNWGYLILGPMRGVALYPLPLIFAFGAFSLRLRSIAWLTIFALATLTATMAALQVSRAVPGSWTWSNSELRVDAANLFMSVILMPAFSLVAARLSALRSKLRAQRKVLSAALEDVQRLA
ncbi:MAG: hypothetical protein M3R16_06660, partial [Pseudomonadota bacterium]|nr:hypothetical protein [Pseudomonadota bacterium]